MTDDKTKIRPEVQRILRDYNYLSTQRQEELNSPFVGELPKRIRWVLARLHDVVKGGGSRVELTDWMGRAVHLDPLEQHLIRQMGLSYEKAMSGGTYFIGLPHTLIWAYCEGKTEASGIWEEDVDSDV